MLRDIIRNVVLAYFPPKISFNINVWKNIKYEYLESEMPYIERILNTIKITYGSPVSVDIGANLGLFSYLLNKYSQHVIALEPQPKLAAYLKKVLPPSVSILNVAVSDHSGTARMLIPKLKGIVGNTNQQDALATIEISNPIMMQDSVDYIDVPTKTLDEILHDQSRIDFIKIDVEGHELSVLNGAKIILNKFRPIFMIELFKAHNPSVMECFKIFVDAGFTSFYCAKSGLKECISLEDASFIINNPVLEDRTITNFFFVPSEKRELIDNLFLND